MGVSNRLVFSTWRDADPPRPLSGLVEPLPPESPASDVSWTLTHRETVRPWDPKAQPSRFQNTARSAPGFRDTSLSRPVLLPVSTFGPEPPLIISGEGGDYVRPRDAFHRVMFRRVASPNESPVSFGLKKTGDYAHRFAFSPPPLASGKFGDFLPARSRTLVCLATRR